MPKSDGRCCAVRNCSSNCNFFPFPKDVERCKKWVANSDREDLLPKTAEYLNKNCFLCSKHFESSQFVNFLKIVLKPEAVPTLFGTTEAQKKPTQESNPLKDTEQLNDSVAASSCHSYDNLQVGENSMENTCGSNPADQLIFCSLDSPVVQTEDPASNDPQTTETNSEDATNYSNLIYHIILPSEDKDDSGEAVSDNETFIPTITHSALAEILRQATNVETVEVSNVLPLNNVDNRTSPSKSLPSQSILKTLLGHDYSTSAETACVLKINNNDNRQHQVLKSILKPIPTNTINNVNEDHNYLSFTASSPKVASKESIKNSNDEGESSPAASLDNPNVSQSYVSEDSSMTPFLKLISNIQFKARALPLSPLPRDSSQKPLISNTPVTSKSKYRLKYQNAKKVTESRGVKKSEERKISTQQFKLLCDEFLPAEVAHFIKTKVKIKRQPPLKPCDQNTLDVEMDGQNETESKESSVPVYNNENVSNVQLENIAISGETETNLDELNKTLSYACDLCDFATHKKFFLNRHKYNQHSTDRPFTCDQCNYRAKTRQLMSKHLEMHGGQLYTCSLCTKSYHLNSSYHKHMVKAHKQRKRINSCHLCDFQTGFLKYLKKHLIEKHPSEDPNLSVTKECPYCDCQLKNNAVFEDHLAVKHQVDKDGNPAALDKFKCKQCEFSCVARFQLSSHYHLKHGRKWTCEICEFTCNQKGKLDSHIKFRHLGIKAFVCETCGCQLASKKSLKQHMSRHKPNENHTCTLCSKSFTRSLYLQTHMKHMHSDIEIRHTCPYCEFSARLKGSVNRHIRRKHESDLLVII